ncbi:MAG: sulfotransferase [Alphaproteobacteria bacterium]
MTGARKPDFFIVGAPKCGTTALSAWLREHPRVFISQPKEPHYFAFDFPSRRNASTLDEYLGLFANADERHLAVGEASVWYLYSDVAIPEIMRFNPAARIVVMVRNPVELVPSLHAQLRYSADEDEPNLETAWRRQDERARGRGLPESPLEAAMYRYRAVAMLGAQIERALGAVPREQLRIVVFDDLAADPQAVYRDVLAFLAVPPDGRAVFPRVNESKVNRSARLKRILAHPPPLVRAMRLLRRIPGVRPAYVSLVERIQGLNTRKDERPPLAPEFRRELAQAFRDDVERLGAILDRDLGHWLNP